ncbi:MAG: Mg(2+)-transport-ATPase-associated protein MgtC [uncultured Rubrobacteraceae bacterium]|uniref:Mg(2+)-transport-ATPase-associated protein MgtC n=1 Tax=uncultured Rubrobacteraceae bacterium TaxID=349277 RepID=A0A6J4RMB0_9ACTN|nr:MAG: Mg(2+)-transport-ATPase-associated protein MgtC [uncultured Rubrobacteraceae bacterium]
MENLTISYAEVVVRLLATVVLCGLIGLERETRDQSAGFRTHILLGLGAALFTLVSAYGFPEFTGAALQSGGRGVQFDPTRIAAQVVTGVGFLGAGAIIRRGVDVRGLTTAASLWTAAAIGLACGAGYYFGAAATTAVVIAALYLLRGVRLYVVSRFRTAFGVLSVHFADEGAEISDVTRILGRQGVRIRNTDAKIEDGRAAYELQLRIPPGRSVQEMLGEISALPSVERVGVTGLHEVE